LVRFGKFLPKDRLDLWDFGQLVVKIDPFHQTVNTSQSDLDRSQHLVLMYLVEKLEKMR